MLIGTVLMLLGGQYVTALITAALLLLSAVLFTRTLYGPLPPVRDTRAPRHQKEQ